ncbi:PEP-CTERM sorting domain-containing protein [Planctomycetales bacterium ZRK34]|nr:PEP-CTERM sorting domain-containing protein [Planctomycetales bacterium ZRK34]
MRCLFAHVLVVAVVATAMPARAAILDDVSGAAAAWSLRQLDDDYAGPAINVKRSSDAATMDIGFVGGELDTAALLSFVGSGTGYITTWYDQSGNGRDAIEGSDAQRPKIVIGGVIQQGFANNRIGLRYDGNDALTLVEGVLATNTTLMLSEISVAPASDNSLANRFFNYANDTSTRFSFGLDGGGEFGVLRTSGTFIDSGSGIFPPLHQDAYITVTNDFASPSGSQSYDADINGTNAFSVSGTTNLSDEDRFVIGAQTSDGTRGLNGFIQEVIIYDSVLSTSQLAQIHVDQSAYYIPEPGTFTLAALAAAGLITRRRRA